MVRITIIILFLVSLLSLRLSAQSPYVSTVLEYLPAPGQFVNTPAWGMPAKANSLIGGISGGISLGGFGGYVVVGFDHRIANDPDNPYGVDFTVFGNPLADAQRNVIWSEPGAVMVMKDENGNGRPDDTWYALAGSDYYFNSTVRNYQITYTNPQQTTAANVPWTDNTGTTGSVLANEFHLQPYYPLTASFPGVNQDHLSFTGHKIKGYVDRSNPSYIQAYKRGFGYADNALTGTGSHVVPDNPYSTAIEGAGGDAFDIDWAIDATGNHVHLDGIDFIKIYTAVNEDAGWLGEVSAEVRGVVDVAPNAAIQGVLDQVVMADIPLKLRENAQVPLEAYAFRKGILQSGAGILFSVDNATSAEIVDGVLITKVPGSVTITATLEANTAITTKTTITVVAPKEIDITLATQIIRVHARVTLAAKVLDQSKNEISGIALTWRTSDPGILDISTQGEQIAMRGQREGSAWLFVSATDIPGLKDSVLINVQPEAETRLVYLTIKDNTGLIISRQPVTVKNFDLNAYVDSRRADYGIDKVTGVTAAHALAQLFSNEDFASDLRFRDDARGDAKLYLWRVPKREASVLSYVYGYGGTQEASFDKSWLVRVNERTYTNDLHKVSISEGDEIVVYHVEQVSAPWQFINIRSDKDAVAIHEATALTVIRYTQSMNADRSVSTLTSDAVAEAQVEVNGTLFPDATTPLLTDELGKVSLTFGSQGIKNITIAGEAFVVVVRSGIPVGLEDDAKNSMTVYPNPFQESLTIEGKAPVSYALMTLNGSVLMSGGPLTETTLQTDSLPAGLYLLRIETSVAIKYIKLIKP
jgi:hypothetical protein